MQTNKSIQLIEAFESDIMQPFDPEAKSKLSWAEQLRLFGVDESKTE